MISGEAMGFRMGTRLGLYPGDPGHCLQQQQICEILTLKSLHFGG